MLFFVFMYIFSSFYIILFNTRILKKITIFAFQKIKNEYFMYAIVEIAGLQYKVEQDQKLFVNRLKANIGEEVTFDKVLLTDNGSVTVGAPVIDGVTVVAKVLDQVKGDKVIVFKKKRRKGYKVKNGHRQQFTQIQIVSIGGSTAAPKKTAKKATPKKEKEVVKNEEVKTED